ncbi:MAG: hypothetical protein JXB38_07960 [Anaerolineales bacterium]|nr:hypothetical protein [Anaerolineales bacterium]
MSESQAQTAQKSPLTFVLIAFLVLACIAAAVFGGLYVLGNSARGLSFAAGGISEAAEGVSDTAGDVADVVAPSNTGIVDTIRIKSQLDELILRPTDMDYAYHIDSGKEMRYGNTNAMYERGEIEGKKFIAATGRVEGWSLEMRRTHKIDPAPATYASTIEVFESVDGAQLALSPEWFKAYQDLDNLPIMLDESCDFGEECVMYLYENYKAAEGLTTLTYEIAFTYRNVLVWTSVRGLDYEVEEQDVVDAAQVIYDRLLELELVSAN